MMQIAESKLKAARCAYMPAGWALFCSLMFAMVATKANADLRVGTSWEIEAGPAYHKGVRITSSWRPDSIEARLRPLFSSRSDPRPLMGPQVGYADRDYIDGFVYMDLGTDDPETDTIGLTWFWGYENDSQYSGASVSFHSAPFTDYRTTGVPMDPDQIEERVNMSGINLTASRRFWQRGSVAAGLSLGGSVYRSRSVVHTVQRLAARETSVTRQYLDTYQASVVPFPGAPYENTLEGPGYLLRNEPDIRSLQTLDSTRRDWMVESRHDVEVQVMDVRLGPSLWWKPFERIGLRFTPHVRMAHVDVEAIAHTRIAPTRVGPIEFADNNRTREWVFGLGSEAAILLTIHKGWYLGLSAASDWWQKDVTSNADPFNTRIELGQWTFTAQVGREF
jgi:hypothetical protein